MNTPRQLQFPPREVVLVPRGVEMVTSLHFSTQTFGSFPALGQDLFPFSPGVQVIALLLLLLYHQKEKQQHRKISLWTRM